MTIDTAWKLLFDKHDILPQVSAEGFYRISAPDINTVKEARLMAKFDKSSQLPMIFQANNLSILPITRGEYIIGRFRTHSRVAYPQVRPRRVVIPNLQTLDYTNLYSEASALLFAHNSGIIQDILGSDQVAFTVNGRMSSGNFQFAINDSINSGSSYNVSVQNAQVEIDAGYETPDCFCICEAKNIATEELLVRQLYYPYRLWQGKITKKIIPVFLVFSNDIFHLFRYEFDDLWHYNSIRLVEHRAYTFADEELSLSEIVELWKSVNIIPEPTITFPQADSFERVLDLLSILFENSLTPNEVTIKYEFDTRQTNYYIAACEYLNLIERSTNIDGERIYRLTSEAQKIMSLRYKPKHLALIRKIIERPVFYKVFGIAISAGDIPDKDTICRVMRECGLLINETTIARRASTVRAWLSWIFGLGVADT